MLEKQIEAKLGRMLHRRGALFYKFVSPGRPGVPDRIAVLPGGRVVFIELKTDTGSLSKVQKYECERLKSRNVEVFVVRGMQGVEELIGWLDFTEGCVR